MTVWAQRRSCDPKNLLSGDPSDVLGLQLFPELDHRGCGAGYRGNGFDMSRRRVGLIGFMMSHAPGESAVGFAAQAASVLHPLEVVCSVWTLYFEVTAPASARSLHFPSKTTATDLACFRLESGDSFIKVIAHVHELRKYPSLVTWPHQITFNERRTLEFSKGSDPDLISVNRSSVEAIIGQLTALRAVNIISNA